MKDKTALYAVAWLVVAALAIASIYLSVGYFNACAAHDGFIVGGKSALCWTDNGPLWPWDIW